jgi:hypothetical protein
MYFGAPESITIQGEIAAMRAELASIRAAQQESWVTQERATQIRAVVQDVLADSATRESFRTDGAQCGYDHGSFIRSSASGISSNSLLNYETKRCESQVG